MKGNLRDDKCSGQFFFRSLVPPSMRPVDQDSPTLILIRGNEIGIKSKKIAFLCSTSLSYEKKKQQKTSESIDIKCIRYLDAFFFAQPLPTEVPDTFL